MEITLSTLFEVAKIIAESDSIGEGYPYCPNYTVEKFKNELTASGRLDGSKIDGYAECAFDILKKLNQFGFVYTGLLEQQIRELQE